MGGPKKPKPDYKGMKETYEGWLADIEDSFSENKSANKARLAASGIEKNSDLWKQSMKALESDYQSQLDEVYGSQTYKMVQEYVTGASSRARTMGMVFDPDTFKTRRMTPEEIAELPKGITDKWWVEGPSGWIWQGPGQAPGQGPDQATVPGLEGMGNFGARPVRSGLKPIKKTKGKLRVPLREDRLTWDV